MYTLKASVFQVWTKIHFFPLRFSLHRNLWLSAGGVFDGFWIPDGSNQSKQAQMVLTIPVSTLLELEYGHPVLLIEHAA